MTVSRQEDNDPAFGIVTRLTATELEIWIRGQPRYTMSFDELKFEYYPNIGDWVELEVIGANMFSLSKHNDSLLPMITWDGLRCLVTKVSFLPLKGAYLHPASAVEKNLVMAWTDELGYVPLVFKNNFQNHCFYEGEAQINMDGLSKLPALIKIESDYSTPWLIKKVEEGDYALTRNHSFFDRYKYTGLVVKDDSDFIFVFNIHTGLVAVAKRLAEDIRRGDWIHFHCIVNNGGYGETKIFVENLLPKRIEPVLNCVVSHDGTVIVVHKLGFARKIHHSIGVPMHRTHMGVYEVEQLGSAQDLDGLIGCNMENRVIQVKSMCIVNTEREEVTFRISNIFDEASGLYINSKSQDGQVNDKRKEINEYQASPSSQSSRFVAAFYVDNQEHRNGSKNRRKYEQQQPLSKTSNFSSIKNHVKVQGIVFSTGKSHAMLFSSDPAVRNNVAELTLKHISPLPALGDCVELYMKGVGNYRRLEYIHTGACKTKLLYERRILDGNVLEVRTVVNVINKDTIYATKFGRIANYNDYLKLTLAHEGCNCEIWIVKIENNQLHWAVSSNPDVRWQSSPRPKAVPNATGVRSSPYKFIGKQYVNPSFNGSVTPSSPTPDRSRSTEPPEHKLSSSSSPINFDNRNDRLFSTINTNFSCNNPIHPTKRQYSPTPPNSRQNSGSSVEGSSPAFRKPFGHCRRSSPPHPLPQQSPPPVVPAITNSSKNISAPEYQWKWPATGILEPQQFNAFNNFKKETRQRTTLLVAFDPPQNSQTRNYTVKQTSAQPSNSPVKEAFECLGVCVSILKDGSGVFVYTGSSPEQEAFLATHMMISNEKVMHGDWLDFNAKYTGRKFIVTSYRRRVQPVYPTTTIRNTVQLRLLADVPVNFLSMAKDFRLVHTEFVGSVLDDNDWVKPKHINRRIEIVAIRRSKSDTKLPWQILKILKEF